MEKVTLSWFYPPQQAGHFMYSGENFSISYFIVSAVYSCYDKSFKLWFWNKNLNSDDNEKILYPHLKAIFQDSCLPMAFSKSNLGLRAEQWLFLSIPVVSFSQRQCASSHVQLFLEEGLQREKITCWEKKIYQVIFQNSVLLDQSHSWFYCQNFFFFESFLHPLSFVAFKKLLKNWFFTFLRKS